MAKGLDYWKKRERAYQESQKASDEAVARRMDANLRQALRSINEQINTFYERYAGTQGMTIEEAQKVVAKMDVQAFEDKAREYVANKDFSAKANSELKLYNATMRINRLELLKANIHLELAKATSKNEGIIDKSLKEQALAEIRRQAGILGQSIELTETNLKSLVEGDVQAAHFSDTLWTHHEEMMSGLATNLRRAVTMGENPTKTASAFQRAFEKERQKTSFNAKRLLVTELARVQGNAQKEAYTRSGYDSYIFLPESKACKVCKPLNDKVFKIKDMKVGLNMFPMHPFCRCSTAPELSEEEYERLIKESAESRNGSLFGMSARSKETWPGADKNKLISKEDRNDLTDFASQFGIKIQGLKKFDGDIAVLREFVEESGNVLSLFPSLFFDSRRPLTLSLANLADDDFGITRGHVIELNKAIFRDKALLEKRYQDLVDEGWFAKGTNYKSIIHHEMGHVISDKFGIDNLAVAKGITNLSGGDLFDFIEQNLSEYAGKHFDGVEIPSEALSSFMGNEPSVFALQFVREMLKYR